MGTSHRRIDFPVTSPDELEAALALAAFGLEGRRVDAIPTDYPIVDAAHLRRALGPVSITCECRCRCHFGVCHRPIEVEVLDCSLGCRGQRSILDSECQLDGAESLRPSSSTSEVLS